MPTTTTFRWGSRGAVVALGLLLVASAPPAWAVGNPAGCSDPSVTIEIREFRDLDDNGVPDQQLLPFDAKIPGEVILYQAALFHESSDRCGFEQGRLCIDLPQLGCPASNPAVDPPSFTTVGPGECCAVDLTTPVPLVCDGGAGCVPAGVSEHLSDFVRYVVNPADSANPPPSAAICAPGCPAAVRDRCPEGQLRAVAYYDSGLSKQGGPADPDVIPANASIPICNKVEIDVQHFMCYEVNKIAVAGSVSLEDRFRSVTGTLGNLKRLCNPTDKNQEDPSAINFPDHLTSYEIETPAFANRQIEITNQFGTAAIEIQRGVRLLVPTAKGPLGPPPQAPAGPPNPPQIDHFECYAAKGSSVNTTVRIDDQFGTLQVAVKRPELVCVPVNKRDEGFVNPNGALGFGLTCYEITTTPDRQQFRGEFYIDNQLTGGALRREVHGPREFCVQSSIRVP